MTTMTNNRMMYAQTSTTTWGQRNQEELETHIAWHPNISETESEKLLQDKSPFTYLLRSGGREQSYFISFVKKDKIIKHQFFVLEFEHQRWFYRNGTTWNHQELALRDLNKLIPMMMHCDLVDCTPLMRSK